MTSPNTTTSRTATPARTGRPDTRVRAALWVLIVLSAAANAAISITGLGLLPHLLSGLVCLGFVVALVVVHRRR